MYAIITLLVVLTLSLAITRVATVALMMTGLSRDVARFQARSAFTGVGFPTEEGEAIMRHPVRRQIIMLLMLLHNLGFATVIATIVIGVLDPRGGTWLLNTILLLGGLFVIWQVARSHWLDEQTSKTIAWALSRFTELDVHDYVALLHLSHEYAVLELRVEPGHWLVNKNLREVGLPQEGILVLGIERATGRYIGVPTGSTIIQARDVLVLYGPLERLQELDRRRADLAGYLNHLRAKRDRDRRVEQETKEAEEPVAGA